MSTIEVRIEKLVYGGEGLGRLDGRAVLVPLVLPGEQVAVEPVHEQPRLLRARLVQVIEPAAERVAADCPYFTGCGGCHYQHTGYEHQLRYKAAILAETLRRVGKLEAPPAELIASPPWHYRNRAQFKFAKSGDDFRLGYFELGSRRLLPIEQCPISAAAVNAVIPELYALGRRPDCPLGTGEIEVLASHDEAALLVTATGDLPWPETLISAAREHIPAMASFAFAVAHGPAPPAAPLRVFGRGHLIYQAGGFGYRVSHGSFFQTNRYLADSMAGIVTEGFQGGTAVDLYSGVGYFSLPLARQFQKVIAVESNRAALRDLDSNRQRAAATNLDLVDAPVEEFLRRPIGTRPDLVLLDPPRAGLGQRAAQLLLRLAPPIIQYVSCDPATLARDAAVLVAGGYRLERLRLIDLFPQTFHIEAIGTLNKSQVSSSKSQVSTS